MQTFGNTNDGGKGSAAIGNAIKLDPEQIKFYIDNTSSDLNKNTLGWGMVFIHGYLHTPLGRSLKDPHVYGTPGEVEDVMNDIRGELGEDYSFRASYKYLILNDGYGYIPFSALSNKIVGEEKEPPVNSFVKTLIRDKKP